MFRCLLERQGLLGLSVVTWAQEGHISAHWYPISGNKGRGQGKDREKAHTPLSTRQAPTLHRWQSGV